MAKRTKKRLPIGCFFWLIFILLIGTLFFLNKDTIVSVLEKTQAKNILLNRKPKTPEKLPGIQIKEETPETSAIINAEMGQDSAGKNDPPAEIQKNEDHTPEGEPAAMPQANGSGEPEPEQPSLAVTGSPAAQHTAVKPQQSQTQAGERRVPEQSGERRRSAAADRKAPDALRKTVIYWIQVDNDGKLVRKTAIRMLPKSNVPMSDALEAQFTMPVFDEAKQGLRTLIPAGTKLRSAWVKDGVAFINVSEEFQFNQYGIEGALAQLSQVVFTATEFPTVKSVQFLIEGEQKDYLGAEGVWIGSPLSRNSF
ncbi:MAG: GerMN domain-containing protein [Treponema sp.]